MNTKKQKHNDTLDRRMNNEQIEFKVKLACANDPLEVHKKLKDLFSYCNLHNTKWLVTST